MEVDELPAPIPPNKHSGPVTLVIHLSVLILPFSGGATGHDGRIAVESTTPTEGACPSTASYPRVGWSDQKSVTQGPLLEGRFLICPQQAAARNGGRARAR